MKQNHSVNIIFDGTMQDLIGYLDAAGIVVEFIPPGLINSSSVLEIKTDEKDKETNGN